MIVLQDKAHHHACADEKVIAQWESGLKVHRQCDVFRCDDTIVFHLACVAFVNSPGEIYFAPPGKARDYRADKRLTLLARVSLWALTLPVKSVI